MKRRVDWIPVTHNFLGQVGRFWHCRINGVIGGYVIRLPSGIYEGNTWGSRVFRHKTMDRVARRIVAHVNTIYPCQLPR